MKTKQEPLPFRVNLGGFERVVRSFARKAWVAGIPVWQDTGHGAMLLAPPASAIPDDTKPAFDRACLAAEPWIQAKYKSFSESLGKKCVYLVPYGGLALHFKFQNGSNPFVKYGTCMEILIEIQDWSRRWNLAPELYQNNKIVQFTLVEKNPAPEGLFTTGP